MSQKKNKAAWDQIAQARNNFSKVATDRECRDPLGTLDSRGWLPRSVAGLDVLCLASGGGWQSILYASAGASVTVVDLSPEMLSLDVREAKRRELDVRAIEASMDHLPMLGSATFDIVHQPVSTCYVSDIGKVYAEIARVLRGGGLYISQHKTPTSLQVTRQCSSNEFVVGLEYYRTTSLPSVEDGRYREEGAIEYLHRWEELVGELCRQGLVIEDLREPYRGERFAISGSHGHRGRFVAPYVRIKARRLPMS
ncbi:hypothetical protein Pan216_00280 [Planctomycetes bacterium Pan216]|uniref:Methyltransferase type 11 domain-containing protein n=1 Tax=Kolteria novifilia TaxID=2527975 RepID=A0A518AWW9_9BACT|nr:hypothetical protein Pan216_00280 [Planctomycetes bacterium Pan216]